MDNFDLKKYLVENKATTNSKMLDEVQNNFYKEFTEAYKTFLENTVSPEDTEIYNFTDRSRDIEYTMEYPTIGTVIKHTIDALKAAGIDSIEKLYTVNKRYYYDESIEEYLTDIVEVEEHYAGSSFEIIPGVTLDFSEET